MRFVTLAAGATIALVLTASQTAPTAATQAPPPSDAAAAHRAALNRYCVPCHNERNKANAGRLALDSVDLARGGDHAEMLEKVILKLRAGVMPPPGRSRPEPAARAALVGFLETELDRHAAAVPNPGRTEAFHRLNRAEYRNAVRDLLGLELDMTSWLPADDASYGFDNMAGALGISQARPRQYPTVPPHTRPAA